MDAENRVAFDRLQDDLDSLDGNERAKIESAVSRFLWEIAESPAMDKLARGLVAAGAAGAATVNPLLGVGVGLLGTIGVDIAEKIIEARRSK